MNKNLKNASIYIAIFIGILILVMMTKNSVVKSVELSYNEFTDKLNNDQVAALNIDGNKITGELSDQTIFETYIPSMLSPITGTKISEIESLKTTGI